MIDRSVDTESATLVTAYETRLREMEDRKRLLSERSARTGQPAATFREIYRTAFEFLANPQKLWASEHLEDKLAVLKLVFADRLAYARSQGYRTAKNLITFQGVRRFSER